MLSDWVEIPNLYQRGLEYVGYLFQRHVFGVRHLQPPYAAPGGVMLATHGGLGEALTAAMEMIVGEQRQVAALSLQVSDRLEDAAARLQAAVARVDGGDGVLVLTDMLGGTPSHICLSLLGGPRPVEVVSGSLPMLLKAVQARRDADLRECAAQVKKVGRAAIIVASEALSGGATS